MSNTATIKEKRRRISVRYNIQGEIVAKSYVENFHKNKHFVKQLIIYDNLSFKITDRKLELIQGEI
jgi:hypothetical protein